MSTLQKFVSDVVVEAEKSAQDIIAERIAAKKAQAAK